LEKVQLEKEKKTNLSFPAKQKIPSAALSITLKIPRFSSERKVLSEKIE